MRNNKDSNSVHLPTPDERARYDKNSKTSKECDRPDSE